MLTYYFYNQNTNADGYHQVHTPDCSHSPEAENMIALGMHADCQEARRYAESFTGKTNFDSCKFCCTYSQKSKV